MLVNSKLVRLRLGVRSSDCLRLRVRSSDCLRLGVRNFACLRLGVRNSDCLRLGVRSSDCLRLGVWSSESIFVNLRFISLFDRVVCPQHGFGWLSASTCIRDCYLSTCATQWPLDLIMQLHLISGKASSSEATTWLDPTSASQCQALCWLLAHQRFLAVCLQSSATTSTTH